MYFSVPQKAEFFTLKGMFIVKLGHNDEANDAFGQAVQMDLNMPKTWAQWGRYNDHTFKENPTDMVVASNAVSCYLQAAGLYKNSKTRPLLIRILWFLSLDDPVATISKAFENFKGDIALWYWITLIPQLLKALSHRAARHFEKRRKDIPRTSPPKSGGHFRTRVPSRPALQRLHRFARCNIQPRTDIPPLRTGNKARGDRHTDLQAPARAHLRVTTTTQQIGSAQRRHQFAIAILHVLANLSCVSNLTNPASPPPRLPASSWDRGRWHMTSRGIDRAPGLSATSSRPSPDSVFSDCGPAATQQQDDMCAPLEQGVRVSARQQ